MIVCKTYNFGNRGRFGIALELTLDPEIYGKDWLHGSACYWIDGQCIGEGMLYDISLSYDVLGEIENIIEKKSFSCSKDIFDADAKQLLQIMDKDMENEVDDIVEENCFGFVGTYDFWEKFEIHWQLDIMAEDMILLFEHETQARIIVAKLDKKKNIWKFRSEHLLNAEEVQAVFQEACDWLRQRCRQEGVLLDCDKK